MNTKRRLAAKYYHSKLKDVKGISLPSQKLSAENSWHLYVIKILDNFTISRNSLFQNLLSNGIRTSVHYKPLHLFSLYKKTCKITSSLRNSKKLYREILSLPMFPGITRKQQNLVIGEIKNKMK
jgi:dTDP-4-amino-4,6-dideoxygalactose transaminase